jgi:hypothetical protein
MEQTIPTKQSNRRKSHRRKPRSSVKIECRKGSYGLGANIAVATLDLSDTGACLTVSQSQDLLAEMEIVIIGYGMKKPIKRAALLRWQVPMANGHFCIGAEFQNRLEYRDWQNLASPS